MPPVLHSHSPAQVNPCGEAELPSPRRGRLSTYAGLARVVLSRKVRAVGQGETRRLVGGSALVFSCRFAGAVVTFATQVLLARWLGASAMGLYVYAFSTCLLLSILCGMGYPPAAFRFIGQGLALGDHASIRGFARRGAQLLIGTGMLVAVVGSLLLVLWPGLVSADRVGPLRIALVGVPIFALLRLNSTIAHANSWISLSFIPAALARPVLFLAAVAVAWFGFGMLAPDVAMLLHLAVIVLVTGVQYLVLRRSMKRSYGEPKPVYATRQWLRTSYPLLITLMMTAYLPEINVILVGAYCSADEVAIFNAAFRTAFMIMFVLQAVDAMILPRVARLHVERDTTAIQQLVTRATHLKFWSALAAMIFFFLFGKTLLGIFGDEFTAGYSSLLILATAMSIQAAVGPVNGLLNVTGHQDRCVFVFGAALLATVVLNAALLPLLGITGAAVAVLLVVLFWTLWLHAIVVRNLNVRPSIFAAGRRQRPSAQRLVSVATESC